MSFVAIKTRIQTRKWTDVNWVQWISGHLYCWMIKSIYNSVLFPPVIASWTCKPIENQYYCWFVKLLPILNLPGRTHNHMESHHKLTIKQAFIYLSLKWKYFSWLNLIIDIIVVHNKTGAWHWMNSLLLQIPLQESLGSLDQYQWPNVVSGSLEVDPRYNLIRSYSYTPQYELQVTSTVSDMCWTCWYSSYCSMVVPQIVTSILPW